VRVKALTWNLFHGRDFPPDAALRTLRSRLLGSSERNDTHLQVNRDLGPEICSVLAAADWDVALLQECPPRLEADLAAACRAGSHRVLTSRNWALPLTSALAKRNPDLIASWEGGSNLTLVRGVEILERRAVVLRRLPERRAMALTRLASGLCVANLHASGGRARAEPDVGTAAESALAFAGDDPLLFGGDLNLSPGESDLFDELAVRHGLTAPTSRDAIDHLLARGLETVERPHEWPAAAREVREDGLAIRLSDHSPVQATFDLAPADGRRGAPTPAQDG
jgi:endonuclease/exonuclease/phosphatase family metal-dependent hydrolase